MERIARWLIRMIPRLLGETQKDFFLRLARQYNLDLLQLVYHERGIFKWVGDESGERYFIDNVLSKTLPGNAVLFDVGGNKGDYSADLLNAFPQANIFCFEPNPALTPALRSRFGTSVNIVECAVGQEVGSISLFNDTDPRSSPHGSVYKGALTEFHGYHNVSSVDVPMTTLDSFALEHSIDVIDFLKIDTEGHEFAVLRGSQRLLQGGRIRIIQFEFNEMNIMSRVFLHDFVTLLREYTLYRIDTKRLLPLKYSPREEIFQFQNVLAVRTDDPLARRIVQST